MLRRKKETGTESPLQRSDTMTEAQALEEFREANKYLAHLAIEPYPNPIFLERAHHAADQAGHRLIATRAARSEPPQPDNPLQTS